MLSGPTDAGGDATTDRRLRFTVATPSSGAAPARPASTIFRSRPYRFSCWVRKSTSLPSLMAMMRVSSCGQPRLSPPSNGSKNVRSTSSLVMSSSSWLPSWFVAKRPPAHENVEPFGRVSRVGATSVAPLDLLDECGLTVARVAGYGDEPEFTRIAKPSEASHRAASGCRFLVRVRPTRGYRRCCAGSGCTS